MMQNHSELHLKWLHVLLLSMPMLCTAAPLHLAMGDVGALKSEHAVSDPSVTTSWAELSSEQKTILAALGAEWDRLRPWQREKMLDIARAYPKLDEQQQLRVQRQLLKWSRMTPFEREVARKRYQQFQSLSPEHRQAIKDKWKAHRKATEPDAEALDFDMAIP